MILTEEKTVTKIPQNVEVLFVEKAILGFEIKLLVVIRRLLTLVQRIAHRITSSIEKEFFCFLKCLAPSLAAEHVFLEALLEIGPLRLAVRLASYIDLAMGFCYF